MPHLVYGGRHWRVSSDELSIPASCAAISRFMWSIMLTVVLAYSSKPLTSECTDGWLVVTFLSLSLIVSLAAIGCEMLIVKHSLHGTIVQTHKRDIIRGQLTYHCILGVIQFILVVFGLIVIASHSDVLCSYEIHDNRLDIIIISIVVISQLIDICSLLCCCYLFSSRRISDVLQARDEIWAVMTWEGRCRTVLKSVQICSCNLFGGSNIGEDLEAVAKVLTNFFHHDGFLDVVPSDVVAGIILVRLQQKAKFRRQKATRISLNESLKTASLKSISNQIQALGDIEVGILDHDVSQRTNTYRRTLENRSKDDRDLMESISWCSVYALAVYSYLMVIYMKPCSGFCSLCHSRLCKIGCSKSFFKTKKTNGKVKSDDKHGDISGDNCCSTSHAGIASIIKKNNAEIVYAAFENDSTAKPYAIFLDHDKESIVIAIRGTLSLEDCITDVLADPIELVEAGERWGFDGRNRWTHMGFLKAAARIRDDLENSKILQYLLGQTDPTSAVSINDPLKQDINYSHYQLVVCGHSLGAATACVLSLLLHSMYPRLKCFAYGTPASVFDARTAADCSSFVTTIVLGSDMVSRLNVHSLAKLREEVLDSIGRCKVNKMVIMQAIFRDFDVRSFMHEKGEEPASEFKSNVIRFTDQVNKRMADTVQMVNLQLPGRIIHLEKSSSENCCLCLNYYNYTAVETTNRDFSEIIISPTMGIEHFPDRYYNELQRLQSEWR